MREKFGREFYFRIAFCDRDGFLKMPLGGSEGYRKRLSLGAYG
jgi:hypothetical protein